MRKKKGSACITIGLLLIAAALSLTGYNIWDSNRADEAARSTAAVLSTMIPGYNGNSAQGSGINADTQSDSDEISDLQTGDSEADDTAEGGHKAAISNRRKKILEGEGSGLDLKTIREFNQREMPAVVVDDYRYIGVLDIDSLGLSLPVMEEWDYPRLRISPCRFSGSVYLDNMIVCAHNYAHHFSPLKYAPLGTVIRFTDVDGDVFVYETVSVETINPDRPDQLMSGDWDLTLFTCNTGGQTRCIVRCERIA